MTKFIIPLVITFLIMRLIRSLDIYQVIETNSNNVLKYGNYYACKEFRDGFHDASQTFGNNLTCIIVLRFKKKIF